MHSFYKIALLICFGMFSMFQFGDVVAQNVPNGATQVSGSISNTISVPSEVYIPNSDPNSVNIFVPRTPYMTASGVNASASSQGVKAVFSYRDGFNRTFQTVDRYAIRSDNVLKDRVVIQDNRPMLEKHNFLPYTTTHNSNFRPDAFGEQSAFYTSLYQQEGYTPYSIEAYSSDAGSRSSTTYLPGKSQVGQNRKTTTTNLTNTSGEVRMWSLDASGLPVSNGFYQAKELFVEKVQDPEINISMAYTDKNGRIVLSKRLDSIYAVVGSNTYFYQSTYYIYDDFGRLRYLLPPKAAEAVESNNWVVTSSILNGLCFQYQYDSKGRLSAERKPGERDFTRFVYDRKQRIVMRQTPEEKKNNKWEITFYDRQSRVIATGLFNNSTARNTWQSFFDDYSGAAYGTNNIRYYLVTDAGEGVYPPETGVYNTTIMSYTWYDDYREIDPNNQLYNACLGQVNFTDTLTGSEAIGAEAPTRSLRTHGLVTGSKVRILPAPEANPAKTGQWRQSYNWYDDKGRLTFSMSRDIYQSQVIHAHYTGNQYDFSNRLLLTKHKVINSNSADGMTAHTELIRNIYESITGNLVEVGHKVNNDIWKILAKYEYDELGRLKREVLGNNGEVRDYDYNIRGQLTGINAEYAEAGLSSISASRTFGESLKYDYGMSNPRYDGKVSGMLWRGSGGSHGVLAAYGYDYDLSGRLSRADYNRHYDGASPGPTAWSNILDDRSVKDLYYDKNGNILSMTQRGPASTALPVNIDQLGYNYSSNTNQLLSVNDGIITNYGIGDFQNGINSGADYAYDDNGNLTQDLNKGITLVTYNHFNKPETILFSEDGKSISYSYDAAGNKVQELISLGGTVTRTDYIGNFIYRNDSLRYALTGQGRTVWMGAADSTKEEFFVKDHLGNVRSVVDVYTFPIIDMMTTYEIASANLETMVFDKVDEIRVAKPTGGGGDDHMAGRLNATEEEFRVGTSILMHVMAGDRIEMNVDNYYDGYNKEWDEVLNPEELMDNILTTLTVGNGGFEGSESHQTDLVEQLFNPDNFLQAIDIMQDNIDENKPKAFLNYILFNEDMEVVTEFTGSFQVDGNGTWSTIGTPEPMDIPENGYLAVYVSTQTQIECDGCEASASDVYFDYFSIRFTRGNLKEETHYYPFGLPMATSAAAGFMPNRHRYQSNEYRKEAGLNWMDFHARQYDPQIGRFLSVDPLADAGGQQVFSPYAAMGNNPVSMTDPGGMMHDVFKNGVNPMPDLFALLRPFSPGTLAFMFSDGGTGGIPSSFLKALNGGNEAKVTKFTAEEVAGFYSFFSGSSTSDVFTKNFGAGGGGGSSKSDRGGDDSREEGSNGYENESDTDNFGKKLKTAGGMFMKWITGGLGTSQFSVYDDDDIAGAMRNASGVKKAREFFYEKYKNAKSLEGASVTNYGAKFGIMEFFAAGIDPIEQFVGSYKIDIYYRSSGSRHYLQFNLTNTTSATSFFYHMSPSHESSGPMGNYTQLYQFTEPVDVSKLKR